MDLYKGRQIKRTFEDSEQIRLRSLDKDIVFYVYDVPPTSQDCLYVEFYDQSEIDYGEGLPLFPAIYLPHKLAMDIEALKGMLCQELSMSKLKYPTLIKAYQSKTDIAPINVLKYLITD